MSIKIFKRTDTARSVGYQNDLLFRFDEAYVEYPTFTGLEDIPNMLRPTKRSLTNCIVTGSIALLADTESEAEELVKQLNANKLSITVRCLEEAQVWKTPIPKLPFLIAWKDARKRGAAKRGAEMSAASKKAKTAAALKLIEDDLKKDGHTTRELLDRVGVKSVNSIKNHYGITREQMQIRYRAELKRKERRNAKR
jgi:hypothetical protein